MWKYLKIPYLRFCKVVNKKVGPYGDYGDTLMEEVPRISQMTLSQGTKHGCETGASDDMSSFNKTLDEEKEEKIHSWIHLFPFFP